MTSQHVDVVVKWSSDRWEAMGRVLLDCYNVRVHDITSRLSSQASNSEKLQCLIEEWLRHEEEPTVSKLLEACGHCSVNTQGIEREMEKAGLL